MSKHKKVEVHLEKMSLEEFKKLSKPMLEHAMILIATLAAENLSKKSISDIVGGMIDAAVDTIMEARNNVFAKSKGKC